MTPIRPSLFWIVGSGGLLGSRLRKAIPSHIAGGQCWDPPVGRFSWGSTTQLDEQLAASAAAFGQAVSALPAGCGWSVVWTAGAGVIGTTEPVFAAETAILERLLGLVDSHLLSKQSGPGVMFLSSSAGGMYGNCPDQTITERSECRPVSAYGANKQRQENLFNSWADDRPQVTCRIGRISNLYGPGQNLSKPQGLISHISRSLLWQQPIHIYVPLDTIRDYVHVNDCSRQIVSCLGKWITGQAVTATPSTDRVKIFAAEEPTSVAQIIGAFTRLATRRHPRVMCSPSALGLQQPRRLQFRSVVAPVVTALPKTTLQVGIHELHNHQTALYRRGHLPMPPAKA